MLLICWQGGGVVALAPGCCVPFGCVALVVEDVVPEFGAEPAAPVADPAVAPVCGVQFGG